MALTQEKKKKLLADPRFQALIGKGSSRGATAERDTSVKGQIQSRRDRVKILEETPVEEEAEGVSGLGGVAVGAGKGALGTFRGASSLGEKIIKGLGRIVTPKKFEKTLGFEKTEDTSAERLISEEAVTPVGTAEKIGAFGEQVAEFAVPISKVTKATKGLGAIQKVLAKIGTSAGVASLQEGEVGKEAVIAGAVEGALPVVGKVLRPVTNVIGRLFKGLGSGLSGASTDVIEQIYKNPKNAIEVSKAIISEGQETILERNAKTILEGVSKIRKQARGTFGKGLEKLKGVDIDPSIIKKNLTEAIKKNGITKTTRGFNFSASEILDKGIQKRAAKLLKQEAFPDGKDLRRFLDKVEASKFKSALDPDRQAYNNLAKNVSESIKKAINESTPKLKEINKAFSNDMQLAEGMEGIFRKVKFKNKKELDDVARKLEGLFNKKGLDHKTIDDFLTRIKVDPTKFRTSEAVRGIVTKTSGANTKGLSFAEVLQQVTSSVVTPTMVKNLAVTTGLGEGVVNQVIKNVSPAFRATVIKSLIEANK